ncbi:MAG TPA: TonB-dependent receptor plug domain-containing protein [Telmatospirillum sp.]|nr:TonB-dependent receptor plug domain-containing protein [Telmatospirillum sp.]
MVVVRYHTRLAGASLAVMMIAAGACLAAETVQNTGDSGQIELPKVSVESAALTGAGADGKAPPTEKREDLQPDSLSNPFRVPTTNRAGVEVFSAEDIQNLQPRDVFDLLDKATGMMITYQGRKNPYFVKERGGGNFAYVIDGVVLPSVTQRILQRIPLAAIEELEVVRDATALTLGPLIGVGSSGGGGGLITGYIVIRTRQPQKSEELSLASSIEDAFNQPVANKESAYVGKQYGVSTTDVDMKGYVAGFASHFDRPSKVTWFDGQNGVAGMGKTGFGSDQLFFNLEVFDESGRFEMQRGINPVTGARDTSKWYYDPAKTSMEIFSGTAKWTDRQTTIASVSHSGFHQTEHDDSFTSNINTTPSQYQEDTDVISIKHNARFWDTYVHLGGQSTESKALGSSGPTPSTRWDNTVTGYAGTVEQRLFDDAVSLDIGYRQDEQHISTNDTTTKLTNARQPPAEAISGGARWQITPVYALNGRYYDGSQGTSGSYDMRALPGTTIDPENQQRSEATLEGKFLPELNVSTTWFNVIDNNQKSITTTSYTYSGSTYYYYTESNNKRSGTELVIRGKVFDQTSYKTSWTHLYRNISSNASVASTVANNLFDFTVTQRWNDWTGNVSVKTVDSYLGSSSMGTAGGPVMIGGFTRLDANVSHVFHWNQADWTTTLYGRNLTGSTCYTQQGPTGLYPDRGATIGIEFKVDY